MPAGKLALFDFDGTITSRDTLIEFPRFVVGSSRFARGMIRLAPLLVMHKAGLVGSQKAKEIFLTHFFEGFSLEKFRDAGLRFTGNMLPGLIRPAAFQKITSLKENDFRIVVVSASAYNWIEPWTKSIGVELIATRSAAVDSKLTGKIEGQNCNREEKVNRIREIIDLDEYDYIEAYGDTSGDIPMLKLANRSFFRPFRDKT